MDSCRCCLLCLRHGLVDLCDFGGNAASMVMMANAEIVIVLHGLLDLHGTEFGSWCKLICQWLPQFSYRSWLFYGFYRFIDHTDITFLDDHLQVQHLRSRLGSRAPNLYQSLVILWTEPLCFHCLRYELASLDFQARSCAHMQGNWRLPCWGGTLERHSRGSSQSFH